jgi:hypothetical protein
MGLGGKARGWLLAGSCCICRAMFWKNTPTWTSCAWGTWSFLEGFSDFIDSNNLKHSRKTEDPDGLSPPFSCIQITGMD